LDQRLGSASEPRFWLGMPQFGNSCSMEYVTKAGLCRRLDRRVNIIASKNPTKAPRNASVIERLLKVRRPWPVRRNPVYAMATVQKIARPFMPSHLGGFPTLSPNACATGRCLKGTCRENFDECSGTFQQLRHSASALKRRRMPGRRGRRIHRTPWEQCHSSAPNI
jgi:hypothetical protein